MVNLDGYSSFQRTQINRLLNISVHRNQLIIVPMLLRPILPP